MRGPMTTVLHRLIAVCLLAIGAFALASTADAQQTAPTSPAAPAKPKAAKSAKPAAKPKPKAATAGPGAASIAPAPVGAGTQPTLLGVFGDWGAYAASKDGKKICFALAKPASSETVPANRPRDPAYMFVSSRPAEKVKDEVSILIGYGFKPNADATLEVGSASYAMATLDDGAWLKNAGEESQLVDAMRKGNNVTVKGTSARGTATTDVFSLKGLSQALDKVGEECH